MIGRNDGEGTMGKERLGRNDWEGTMGEKAVRSSSALFELREKGGQNACIRDSSPMLLSLVWEVALIMHSVHVN